MSATQTGRPRSRRASRSMTWRALNGSPDSATTGGEIEGSGSPAGAGRSGPSPMAGTPVWTLFTGAGISDLFSGDRGPAYHRPRRVATPGLRHGHALDDTTRWTNLHLPD